MGAETTNPGHDVCVDQYEHDQNGDEKEEVTGKFIDAKKDLLKKLAKNSLASTAGVAAKPTAGRPGPASRDTSCPRWSTTWQRTGLGAKR